MDGRHFDALAKRLSSRRTAIGGLFAALLLTLEAASGKGNDKNRRRKSNHKGKHRDSGKRKEKSKDKARGRGKTNAQAEQCWRAGACIPKKGANVSQCNLAGYAPTTTLNCTGCNVSRSNLRGAKLPGANFTRANLSGACLVDADFTGAIFANNTNLANAIFCNTKMPDGSINNSGCAAGTSCCTTPCTGDAQCNDGKICCAGTCLTSTQYGLEATIGEFGPNPDQFNTAIGVAASPDGLTVWVADLAKQNPRVAIWTRPTRSSNAWTYQTSFGSLGSEPNQFFDPFAVAVSPDTLTVWVADAGNDRIAVWRRNTATSLTWEPHSLIGTGEMNNPIAVAVTPDGLTALAAESDDGRISVWKRESSTSTEWIRHSTFGSTGRGNNQFDRPAGVAISADGLTVWVGDANNRRISIWRRASANDTDWQPWTTFGNGGSGPGQIDLPRGVAISPDTLKIWICDSLNRRISVWTRPDSNSIAWTALTTFAQGQVQIPTSVTVTPDGDTAWVGDTRRNSVSVWGFTCPA